MALWILSGKTRVSRYQKKHSPTHTYRVAPKKQHTMLLSISLLNIDRFLADRTIGRAYGTVCRLSVVRDVLYCGKTVRPSEKVSEGVNRKLG